MIAYQTSDERNNWLPHYLGIYNGSRCHMALSASRFSSAFRGCWSLNDLVRKHT